MSIAIAPPVSPSRPVASARHSVIIIVAFLAMALAGALFQRKLASAPPAAHPSVLPLYLQLLALEWGLFLYVWKRGLRRTGTTLRELIGGRSRSWLITVVTAIGLWVAWQLVATGWNRAVGPSHDASIAAYLPRGAVESSLWVVLSLTAGFCEELVFRGYFQRQFAAWTGSRWLAVGLQAVLFGVSHGYQGFAACAEIACFGVLYGAVALWIRDLRPGMLAHAMTDILSGIFGV